MYSSAPLGGDFNLEELEQKEQSLIEHLRTAGMKKTRECQLIDEVLALRKVRRQVFSAVLKDSGQVKEMCEERVREWKVLMTQMKQDMKEQREDIERRNSTLLHVKKEFKEKLADVHQKYKQLLADEVKSVKEEYNKKLVMLEGKIEEVQSVHGRRSSEEEGKRQAQFIKAAVDERSQELDRKYSSQMQRYKDALKSLVEKERRLEEICREKASQANSLLAENKQQKDLIRLLEAKVATIESNGQASEATQKKLEKRLQVLSGKCKQLEASRDDEINSAKSITDDAISSMQSRHVTELNLVDEKVRRALGAKDETIRTLQAELDQVRSDNKKAEDLLCSLNNNIRSNSSSSRR